MSLAGWMQHEDTGMDAVKLRDLLEAVAAGEMAAADAMERLRTLPFEDIGFAKIDHHRALRKGYPETIFCSGKTPEQVVTIVSRMRERDTNILATRCSPEVVRAVLKVHPDAEHHELARAIRITVSRPEPLSGYVAIVCAGTSDLPVAEEAAVTCEAVGGCVKRVYDVGVAGIHRLLNQHELLNNANALVVCAGMEGALPSVIAGFVETPVIAVPTSVGYGANFGGLAPLLTMLNSCASGIAVVNIDNGFGAGIYAATLCRMIDRNRPPATTA